MTKEENINLILKAQEGDKQALNRVVEHNLRLVSSIARKFLNRGYEYEDLFQLGSIGLMKAINNFDTQYDAAFSTYAVPVIEGEIKRFFRDNGIIKVSRELRTLGQKLYFAKQELGNELNREPTNEELANYTNMALKEVEKVLLANSELKSLSSVVHAGESTDITLEDKLESNESMEEKLLDKIVIEEALQHLDEVSSNVIRLRYIEDKTQVVVAKKLGISQIQVSRLEKKALVKLKRIMEGNKEYMEKKNKKELLIEKCRLLGTDKTAIAAIAKDMGLTVRTVETYISRWKIRQALEPKANKTVKLKPKERISPVAKVVPIVETKLLRPVLLKGNIMNYTILEDGFNISSEGKDLFIDKNNLEMFIQELQELKAAM